MIPKYPRANAHQKNAETQKAKMSFSVLGFSLEGGRDYQGESLGCKKSFLSLFAIQKNIPQVSTSQLDYQTTQY